VAFATYRRARARLPTNTSRPYHESGLLLMDNNTHIYVDLHPDLCVCVVCGVIWGGGGGVSGSGYLM
jgi:hypothetical protein